MRPTNRFILIPRPSTSKQWWTPELDERPGEPIRRGKISQYFEPKHYLRLHADFLQRDELSGVFVQSFVHHPVCALADLLQFVIVNVDADVLRRAFLDELSALQRTLKRKTVSSTHALFCFQNENRRRKRHTYLHVDQTRPSKIEIQKTVLKTRSVRRRIDMKITNRQWRASTAGRRNRLSVADT